MMDTGDDFPGPVNLGNPNEFTIEELTEQVLDLTGSKSQLNNKLLPQDDPGQRQPYISLAREKLGRDPKTQLRAGLIRTINYLDQPLVKNAAGLPALQVFRQPPKLYDFTNENCDGPVAS
jgi:UDP-glucuronate decarboxylase